MDYSRKNNIDHQVLLLHSHMSDIVKYSSTVTHTEHGPDIKLTIYTPYLTLTGELWGVCCEEFEEIHHSVNKSSVPQDRSTTQLLSSTVHAWVVTEWPLQCLH